jgi:excisionase family DNA binding protein
MPKAIEGIEYYSTSEVAESVGVHRLTHLRWIREGRIQDATRDRNGWRIFSPDAVAEIKTYAFSLGGPVSSFQPTLFSRPQSRPSQPIAVAAGPAAQTEEP